MNLVCVGCGAWCGAGVALLAGCVGAIVPCLAAVLGSGLCWLLLAAVLLRCWLAGRRVHAQIPNSLAAAGGAGVARALHPCGGGWLCSLLLVRRKLAFVLEVVFVGPGGHAVLPLHPAHLVSLLD